MLLLTGCGALTRLVPGQAGGLPPGFQARDFRSDFGPGQLNWDPDGQLYGLGPDLAPAAAKFSGAGETAVASDMRSFAALTERPAALRVLGWGSDQGPRQFLASLPSLPAIGDVAQDISRFAVETPNIKTDLVAAFDTRTSPPLVINRVSQAFTLTAQDLSAGDFALYESPGSVFTGLATKFEEGSRTAADAGVREAAEQPYSSWTLTSARSVLLFARSLQPKNEFQALMECASVTVRLESGRDLALSWPRLLVWESPGGSMLSGRQGRPGVAWRAGPADASRLRLERRPALYVLRSPPSDAAGGAPFILTAAQPRDDVALNREPSAATLRWQRNLFDGAGNGSSYALFHEANSFYLYRFFATIVDTQNVRQSLTQFRMPYSAALFGLTSRRNEFGLWRRSLSQVQQDYVKSSGDGNNTNLPADKWTTLEQLYAIDDRGQRRSLTTLPDTARGGVSSLDTTSLAENLDATLLQPLPRVSAADSSLVTRDKFAELELLCKRAFL